MERALRDWRNVPESAESSVKTGTKPLGLAVQGVMRSLGLETRMRESALLARWPALVGDDVAAHARPQRYANGILTVLVNHPTWMWELRGMKPLMVRRINEELGRGFVKDIVFRADG